MGAVVLKAVRSQLELGIERQRAPDRNFEKGGRSFYFFDLDDNVFILDTEIFIFEKETGREVALSTRHYGRIAKLVGKPGPWENYRLDLDDAVGSFRRFRDLPAEALAGKRQPFVEDLAERLRELDVIWKGPSWDLFDHAVFNNRPLAIITARGHQAETIRQGLELLHTAGALHGKPDLMAIFAVSNPEIRRQLGDADLTMTIPDLKKLAIVRSVEIAMQKYGANPHHRFGMSDDDPHNVELAVEAMHELKIRFPDNAFFVIDASHYPVVKTEVLLEGEASHPVTPAEQLELFGADPSDAGI